VYAEHLGRDMRCWSFGHAGTPVLVFPTSMGKYFEYEDRGMVHELREKLENGVMQLYCVDSVRRRGRVQPTTSIRASASLRHIQYEDYIKHEVLALIAKKESRQRIMTHGCSSAPTMPMNSRCVIPEPGWDAHHGPAPSTSQRFLDGYYDEDCYFHNPPDYIRPERPLVFSIAYARTKYIMVTGEPRHVFWNKNEEFAATLRSKGIPHHLFVWGDGSGHDWNWWLKMANAYCRETAFSGGLHRLDLLGLSRHPAHHY